MLFQECYHDGQSTAVVNATGVLHVRDNYSDWKLFPLHCHSFYEVQYFYDNSASHGYPEPLCADRTLRLYAPFQLHTCEYIGFHNALILQLSPRFIQRCIPSFPQGSVLALNASINADSDMTVQPGTKLESILIEIARKVPQFFGANNESEFNTLSRSMHTPFYEMQLNTLTLQLLLELLELGEAVMTTNTMYALDAMFHDLLKKIISSPSEHIPMRQAAAMTHMSYFDFSRSFKEKVGYGYTDFCNLARVSQAEEIIRFEQASSTEIADRLNFGSASYFNRVFHRFTGMTPSQYKQMHNNS